MTKELRESIRERGVKTYIGLFYNILKDKIRCSWGGLKGFIPNKSGAISGVDNIIEGIKHTLYGLLELVVNVATPVSFALFIIIEVYESAKKTHRFREERQIERAYEEDEE